MASNTMHTEKTMEKDTPSSRDAGVGRAGTPRTDELRDNLSEVGNNLRQAASNAIPAAQEQVQRAGESAANTAQSVEAYLMECIHDKPLGSILVAGLVGMFVGAFVLRR